MYDDLDLPKKAGHTSHKKLGERGLNNCHERTHEMTQNGIIRILDDRLHELDNRNGETLKYYKSIKVRNFNCDRIFTY